MLGCHKPASFTAAESEVEGSYLPSDAFYCSEGEWWDSEKKEADKSLGVSSLSLHSDCKPNIVSSSLLKKRKKTCINQDK